MFKKIGQFFKEVCKNSIRDDFAGMASEMAFSFILAFFPFMIFLISIFGVIGTESQVDNILTYMSDFVPHNIITTIQIVLKDIIYSSTGSLLTLGFFFAMIIASNGTAIMIKGLNRAYNLNETRPLWYVRGLSVTMLFVNTMVLFIGVNIIIFGKIILQIAASFVHVPYELINTVLFVRWPIAFMALFTMAFLNYYFMPNVSGDTRKRMITTLPGSLFFCFFWLFASWVFGLYVDNFSLLNKVYGTLGGFLILLLWLYYTSLVILVGAEINSQIYKKLAEK